MAFHDEDFWMLNGVGNVTLGDSFIDNSFNMELKRGHEWFSEAAETELHPRKKQALETPISSKLESGVVNIFPNELTWENEYMDWLFGSDRNTSLVTTNNPLFENNSSAVLPISYDNRVQESENRLHKPVEVKHDSGTSKDIIISNNKRDSNRISCGSYYQEIMEALAKPVSSYSLLYEQPIEKKAANVKGSQTAKNKSEKKLKVAPNSFPTNVKSLTATGMLDGVLVRYVSGSREIPGMIKGPGYLCGCQSCNYSKAALNAYELEQHAGCKTSHPNNHIRFQNGKSIHQVVQELKNTPQTMLFDAIQTVTGSPINQPAFLAWKESFQAATGKIQHIYAKEDANLLELNPK